MSRAFPQKTNKHQSAARSRRAQGHARLAQQAATPGAIAGASVAGWRQARPGPQFQTRPRSGREPHEQPSRKSRWRSARKPHEQLRPQTLREILCRTARRDFGHARRGRACRRAPTVSSGTLCAHSAAQNQPIVIMTFASAAVGQRRFPYSYFANAFRELATTGVTFDVSPDE